MLIFVYSQPCQVNYRFTTGGHDIFITCPAKRMHLEPKFSSPVPQKAYTSNPSGSRCMLFAGQVMKISYPPFVLRVITTYFNISTNLSHFGLSLLLCDVAVKQIKRLLEDNLGIILGVISPSKHLLKTYALWVPRRGDSNGYSYVFSRNTCCGCSLESSRRGNYNWYPQHMFCMENYRTLSFNYPQTPALTVSMGCSFYKVCIISGYIGCSTEI